MEHGDPGLSTQLKTLVFDMGGVLIKLNDPAVTFGLDLKEDEFLRQWIHSEAVREFERGAIDAMAFADAIVEETDLPYTSDEFLHRFRAWPDTLFTATPAILRAAARQHKTALLSNTNALHWNENGLADALQPYFDRTFLSFETGFLKPDEDAFVDLIRHYDCMPAEIAFFDDNPTNITAAADVGLQAFLTRGSSELQENLQGLGIRV